MDGRVLKVSLALQECQAQLDQEATLVSPEILGVMVGQDREVTQWDISQALPLHVYSEIYFTFEAVYLDLFGSFLQLI